MRRMGAGAAIAAVAGLAAAGCASLSPGGPPAPPQAAIPLPPPPPTAQDLLAAEFAWSTRPGPNTAEGVVAYHDPEGRTWTCAGLSVALAPQTRTSSIHVQALYGATESAVEPVSAVRARSGGVSGPKFDAWVRTTTCDAQGGFAFSNLPDGGYYVITPARLKGRGAPRRRWS